MMLFFNSLRLGGTIILGVCFATALAFVCGEAEPTGRKVMVMAPTEGFKGLSGPTKIYNNSHAVVIGINQYSHVRELNGAVRDGKAVAVALRARGFDVKELYDDSATREQIIGELAERLPVHSLTT